MADPNIQVPALPAASVPDNSDLYHVRQGATDKKITYADLKSGITPADVSAVPETRQVNTNGPLTGGGALTGDLTLDINQASETVDGTVELATSAETIAGTDNTRAVHPAGLATLTATTTRKGLVERATDTEASAGTDTERFINSKQLKDKFDGIQSADTVTEGLVRIATVAEAQDLTSDSVAMSPLKMANAFQGSKTTDGYMTLPNGWIVQWLQGPTLNVTNEFRTVNWPIAFPNGVLHVNASWTSSIASGALANQGAYPFSWTKTSVTIAYDAYADGRDAITPLIFAIGH